MNCGLMLSGAVQVPKKSSFVAKKYASTALETVTVKGQITLRKCLEEFITIFGVYTAIPYRFLQVFQTLFRLTSSFCKYYRDFPV